MTRHPKFSRRHAATGQRDTRSPVDATLLVNTPALQHNIFRSLPVPALLLDRHGVVQLVNSEASKLLGEDAVGHPLGQCFVADPVGNRNAERDDTMGAPGAATSGAGARHLSGWMRVADSQWVAAQPRLERAPGFRHGDSRADVIALVHLQLPATWELDPTGSAVN